MLARALLFVLGSVLAPMAARAQIADPEAFVRRLYASISVPSGSGAFNQEFMLAKENRADYFTAKLVMLLDANDRISDRNGGIGCIDFNFLVDGNDSDDAEVKRTLRIAPAKASGAASAVEARFTNFKRPNRLRFSFVRDGARWKISDIESSGNWRLSTFRCR